MLWTVIKVKGATSRTTHFEKIGSVSNLSFKIFLFFLCWFSMLKKLLLFWGSLQFEWNQKNDLICCDIAPFNIVLKRLNIENASGTKIVRYSQNTNRTFLRNGGKRKQKSLRKAPFRYFCWKLFDN